MKNKKVGNFLFNECLYDSNYDLLKLLFNKNKVKGEISMWCTLNVQEVLRKLRTNTSSGLNDAEVEKRQLQYGKNKLQAGKKTSFFVKFIKLIRVFHKK